VETCPAIWNVFHDGIIVRVEGSIPGDLALLIECDYLRKRFTEPGGQFTLTIHDCSKFQFRPWADDQSLVTDLNALGRLGLWILSADETDDQCKVHCSLTGPGSGGVLEVIAGEATLRLDAGRLITLTEIENVAEAYWTEWESRSRSDPEK
jgi:hypothetical protein